jgi:polyhydroxyalkanoate synthesis regulator phasin
MNLSFNMPLFINSSNIITPLVTIQVEEVLIYLHLVADILQIIIQTSIFIIKELFYEAFTNITIDKIVYICVIYNLLLLIGLDNNKKKFKEQKGQIEYLERQVHYLKKTEKMREDFDESLNNELKSYYEYTTNKINAMEKKIKKLEKDLKIYE